MGGWRQKLKRTFSAGEPPQPVPVARATTPEGRAPSGGAEPILAFLLETVLELAEGKLRPEEIDPHGHMLDYGYIDSLSAVTLIATIDEQYAVEVQEVDIVGRLSSLAALAEFVANERAA